VRLGPDSARYILAGQGKRVAKPFHLRVLLPWLCEDVERRWRVVWLASWPLLIGLTAWFGWLRGLEVGAAVAAGVLVAGLPGVWGPPVVRPVGVDLPGMVIALGALVAFECGWWPLGVVLIVFAALAKESMPVWAALWLWSLWPLVGLIAPLVVGLVRKPVIDEVTAHQNLREVHDHPIRTALAAHRGQWRDAWIMVAPWGVCLAGLLEPSWPVMVALVFAYAQLLVATDTVRLLHTAAGIPLALAAVAVIPGPWLVLAVVAHVVWWRKPELI
jgi:hypothetical protein